MKLATKLLKIAEALEKTALYECIADIPDNVPVDFYPPTSSENLKAKVSEVFNGLTVRCRALRLSFYIEIGNRVNERLRMYNHVLASITFACYGILTAISKNDKKRFQLTFDDYVLLVQNLPNVSTLVKDLNLDSEGYPRYQEEGSYLAIPEEPPKFPVPLLHQELKRIAFCYQTWAQREEPASRVPIREALRSLGYTTLGGMSGNRVEGTNPKLPRTLEVSEEVINFTNRPPSPYLWSQEITTKEIPLLKAAQAYLSKRELTLDQREEGLKQLLGEKVFSVLKKPAPEHVKYLEKQLIQIWIVKLTEDKRIRNLLSGLQRELSREGYEFKYKKFPVPFGIYSGIGYFKVPYEMKKLET